MKQRRPAAFTLFCIVAGFIAVFIIPSCFIRASETPAWFGAIVITGSLSMLVLVPGAIIYGLVYKTDDPKLKQRNRIGLWGNVVVLLAILGLFGYVALALNADGIQ